MRNYYFFKVKEEFIKLTKDNPYRLFKIFDEIYHSSNNNINYLFELYNQLIIPFNKKDVNIKIFNNNRYNQNYTKFNNHHMINNYYTDEVSELTINNCFLYLTTSKINSSFIKDINFDNIFVCDFSNKDYFFLENIKES